MTRQLTPTGWTKEDIAKHLVDPSLLDVALMFWIDDQQYIVIDDIIYGLTNSIDPDVEMIRESFRKGQMQFDWEGRFDLDAVPQRLASG